jgi:two-component system sensor histidine kinase HydH
MVAEPRGLPNPTVPPEPGAPGDLESMARLVVAEGDVVAVLVDDAELAQDLYSKLRHAPLVVRGPASIGNAAAVLVDVPGDAFVRIADVRRRARSDAAIVVVARTPIEASVAYAAGAFACLRPPIVPEELAGLLASAIDSRTAMSQATDLIHRLEIEAAFASIGRISAGLTHELANPLAAAVLSLDEIRSELAARGGGRLDPVLAAPFEDLAASVGRIEALVRSLAVLGRTTPSLGPVDVEGVIRQVLVWAAPVLASVEVEEVVEPLRAVADPTMLGQVLLNLITNAAHAARALPSPRVRLHVYPSKGRAVVSVRDNGPGIPEEYHEKIFEPFFTTRRGQGGTGLGLPLCREYAHRMGATLSIWSVPGRGTCCRLGLRTQ